MNITTKIDWTLNEECIQVCIGLYQVILVFTNELTITIECNYLFELGENSLELCGDKAENSSHLIGLLGESIIESTYTEDYILILFSGGFRIKFKLENDGLESLSIIKQEMQIIV